MSEYIIGERLGKRTREENIENARKQILISLKYGSFAVIYFDKSLLNMTDFFQNIPFYVPSKLFVHEEILNP